MPLRCLLALVASVSPDAGQTTSASSDGGRIAAKPPAIVEHPQGGQDFTAEAKLLFRIVACEGDAPLPPQLEPALLEEHCQKLAVRKKAYQQTWAQHALEFIQKQKPPNLPTTVVYPFGGGDLISALTTYPELTEVTTLSLEHAGDPRRVWSITPAKLKESLQVIDQTSAGLLTANDSKTVNLMRGQRGDLPGQLSFWLIGLAVHGYEPVSLRYFTLDADGKVTGTTAQDIALQEGKEAKMLRRGWTTPDFSAAFDNAELVFVKRGDRKSQPKTHRHFARDLDDTHMSADEPLRKYLNSRGRIVAMTKAASYLLWRNSFSWVRNYLLEHMEFMVSDSTGIPPAFATPAGFEQRAFGTFSGSFLKGSTEHNNDFLKLWKNAEPLDFRYGYLDRALRYHMLITQKAQAEKD